MCILIYILNPMVYFRYLIFFFPPEQWVESREGETATFLKKLMSDSNLARSNSSAVI